MGLRKRRYKGIKCAEAVENAAGKALDKGNFALHFRLTRIASKLKRENKSWM